jgi:hypothetical protein
VTKEFILGEIKRTASENGGIAPGRQRFASLTGIKQSDWYGRFWARWGDAVREAGYQPQQRRSAYDRSKLLDHLRNLIVKLGHFPTYAEWRLEATESPGFPAHNTFRTLGTRAEAARELLEYCGDDSKFTMVREVCRPFIADENQAEQHEESLQEDTFGFVYLLRAGKYYKIGKSNFAERRFAEISLQMPEKAQLVHKITTDDPTGIEVYWHRRFSDRRMNGEWFALSSSDIKAFRRRKFM